MLTILLHNDLQHIQILKKSESYYENDEGDEIYFKELTHAYLEWKDNDEDEEWKTLELPKNTSPTDVIILINRDDIDVIEFLKQFDDVEVIVADFDKGVTKICTLD